MYDTTIIHNTIIRQYIHGRNAQPVHNIPIMSL